METFRRIWQIFVWFCLGLVMVSAQTTLQHQPWKTLSKVQLEGFLWPRIHVGWWRLFSIEFRRRKIHMVWLRLFSVEVRRWDVIKLRFHRRMLFQNGGWGREVRRCVREIGQGGSVIISAVTRWGVLASVGMAKSSRGWKVPIQGWWGRRDVLAVWMDWFSVPPKIHLRDE